MSLFDPGPPSAPEPGLSADRRRSAARQAALSRGVHPATRRPLLDDGWGFRCGGCAHAVRVGYHDRSYWKCRVSLLGLSASASSDIRKSWPACDRFRLDPDAH